MCATLGVSHRGYQASKSGGTQNRKRLTEVQMLALIRAIHPEFKGKAARAGPRRFVAGAFPPDLHPDGGGLAASRWCP